MANNRAQTIQASIDGMHLQKATPRISMEKKMGVWVDGKLKLQTRDYAAVLEYASKMMRQQRSVWVTPIGSFVVV